MVWWKHHCYSIHKTRCKKDFLILTALNTQQIMVLKINNVSWDQMEVLSDSWIPFGCGVGLEWTAIKFFISASFPSSSSSSSGTGSSSTALERAKTHPPASTSANSCCMTLSGSRMPSLLILPGWKRRIGAAMRPRTAMHSWTAPKSQE